MSSSSSRGGWKVGIPRTLRDFQARWKSRSLDFSTARLFNRRRCRSFHDRCSLAGVMPQPSRSMGHAQSPIQMLVNDNRAAGQRASPADLVDLQGEVLEADGVIAANRALELEGKDQVQIAARAGGKSGATLGRRHLEAPVELGDIVLAQEAVRLGDRGDSPQAEFLRQTPLPGAEASFRAASRLRR